MPIISNKYKTVSQTILTIQYDIIHYIVQVPNNYNTQLTHVMVFAVFNINQKPWPLLADLLPTRDRLLVLYNLELVKMSLMSLLKSIGVS